VRRKENRCGEQIDRELGLTPRSDLELWIACGKPGDHTRDGTGPRGGSGWGFSSWEDKKKNNSVGMSSISPCPETSVRRHKIFLLCCNSKSKEIKKRFKDPKSLCNKGKG
jgi:hypothetical protein